MDVGKEVGVIVGKEIGVDVRVAVGMEVGVDDRVGVRTEVGVEVRAGVGAGGWGELAALQLEAPAQKLTSSIHTSPAAAARLKFSMAVLVVAGALNVKL